MLLRRAPSYARCVTSDDEDVMIRYHRAMLMDHARIAERATLAATIIIERARDALMLRAPMPLRSCCFDADIMPRDAARVCALP